MDKETKNMLDKQQTKIDQLEKTMKKLSVELKQQKRETMRAKEQARQNRAELNKIKFLTKVR